MSGDIVVYEKLDTIIASVDAIQGFVFVIGIVFLGILLTLLFYKFIKIFL